MADNLRRVGVVEEGGGAEESGIKTFYITGSSKHMLLVFILFFVHDSFQIFFFLYLIVFCQMKS